MIKLQCVDIRQISVRREIVKPTEGVILLNVFVGGPYPLQPPLHWLVGNWKKPPLDIEIDPQEGSVRALQFVIQDERFFPLVSVPVTVKDYLGIPKIDIADWPSNRYLEETAAVTAGWSSESSFYINIQESSADVLTCKIGDQLEMLFMGPALELGGIHVTGLSEKEIRALIL
jgi:hypothetical protein